MIRASTLHPLAWWCWGLSLAIATSRTVNPWLIGVIIASALVVAFLRKSNDPWADAITIGIKVALIALTLRIIIAIIFSVPGEGRVLFTIPRIKLPEWLAGIFLGGPVTWERISYVMMESTTIFALVITIAAASSLANPKQTLRALPGVFHEAGVALIIATTLIPHFAVSVNRIREARKLRGDSARLGLKKTLVPLFEEALEHALIMAESMESRGYGRTGVKKRHLAPTILLSIGIGALLFAILQLLIGGAFQLIFLASTLLILSALFIGNLNNDRSRYRPLTWRINEYLVLVTSITAAFLVGISFNPFVPLILMVLALSPLALTTKAPVNT